MFIKVSKTCTCLLVELFVFVFIFSRIVGTTICIQLNTLNPYLVQPYLLTGINISILTYWYFMSIKDMDITQNVSTATYSHSTLVVIYLQVLPRGILQTDAIYSMFFSSYSISP